MSEHIFVREGVSLSEIIHKFCHAESISAIIFDRFLLRRNDSIMYKKTPADFADLADKLV
ncbi:hypothetical protein DD829_14035 [Chryseobacterium sp. HMWF035]|jgi:hypothetical protein|nr:hypothetical protein DD829_14035 [Chryseobacterium sp. HMWF035]